MGGEAFLRLIIDGANAVPPGTGKDKKDCVLSILVDGIRGAYDDLVIDLSWEVKV